MSQTDRTERLLNLLFALMASARPVPKHVIREAIDGYRESPSDEAFERMFERDKDELRGMGVPIETVEGPDGVGGIDGYRVAVEDYALPEVAFTQDELAVLGVASRVWEQAALGAAAQRALHKLESLGSGVLADGPIGSEARVATAEPSFRVLLDAVRRRRVVRFDYRKVGEDVSEAREVQPYGVASRRGHWYLLGLDIGRAAPRVFRLSRMLGTAEQTGPAGAYEVPNHVDVVAAIAESPAAREAVHTARVQVADGRGHGLRRRAARVESGEGTDVLELTYPDDDVLASELVGLGSAVVVLEPESLRTAVVRGLRIAAGQGSA
jgi:proteasome accessory factor B